MAKNNVILQFDEALAKAKSCEITQADILNEHDLALTELSWADPAMDAEMQARFIKHERALDKFAKRAA